MSNDKQVIENLKRKLQTAITGLPAILGAEAVNFTKERFIQKNWLNTGAEAWPARSSKAKRNKGRGLLIDSGRLFRSIDYFDKTENSVKYGSRGVPYARIHNDGGTITRHARSETFLRKRTKRGRFKRGITAGRGFTFSGGTSTMPRRRFLGHSQALVIRLTAAAKIHLQKSLKQ